MEFKYGGFNAYIINKSEDGFYISDCNGFEMEAKQMIEVAFGLIRYAYKNQDLIATYNQKRKMELDAYVSGEWKKFNEITNSTNKLKKEGYVYLFECGGKYKIGYSKNVERRIKNLDYRPFDINLVAKSEFIENAYDIEQQLHLEYQNNKITGEWYELSTHQVEELEGYLENLRGE